MNRVVALVIVGWIAFAGLGGCQGADPFDRDAGRSSGIGGHLAGSGGQIVTGNGGSGAGGFRASGGSGAGGTGAGGFRASGGSGAGGSNTGGRAMGGSGMGGVGAGGSGAGGSSMGGRGMGGSGAGGRVGDGGANCITTIQMNGYSAGTAPPCSACMDQNHNSYATKCTMMIDCMAAKPQPCTGNCELDCFNMVGGNGPLSGCVDAILMAGGCQ